MDNSHMLAVTALSAFYGNVQVLSSVSLFVHSGEVVCLTGPNGSGKSTLLTVMAGIAAEPLRVSCPDAAGLPSFDDKNIRTFKRKEAASHIAFMCQNEMSTWNYPVFDIVLTGRFPHTPPDGMYRVRDYEIASAVMEELGIGNLTDRPVRSLSGGEFQKVRIARALAQKPDFLLLDEPAANLDFGYQHTLMETVCSIAHHSGIGVLATIHDLNLAARFADRIALLPKLGRCEAGTPREIFNPEKLEAAYGTRFGVFDHPVYRCPQVYAQ